MTAERTDPNPAAGHCIVVASYNIHSCIGMDRQYDPDRVQRVLAELDADVYGLQEVGERPKYPDSIDQFAFFAERTGMHAVAGPNLIDGSFVYGNALLSRWPVVDSRLIRLGVAGREPRGAIAAIVQFGDRKVQIVNTHLGLRRHERRKQLEMLRDAISDVHLPTIFMGDYNVWERGQRALIPLGAPPSGTAPKTFTTRIPLLALDRIWGGPGTTLVHIEAHKSVESRQASDHLPLKAIIELDDAAP